DPCRHAPGTSRVWSSDLRFPAAARAACVASDDIAREGLAHIRGEGIRTARCQAAGGERSRSAVLERGLRTVTGVDGCASWIASGARTTGAVEAGTAEESMTARTTSSWSASSHIPAIHV